MQEETEYINVYGARVHNLKDIDAEIPRNSLTVITGLSGSGKSSLAFDTIFAEGQRRYIETFSAYARNFLGNLERPDVDKITGLSPVISIEQKTTNKNPRSTVGTTTEIYDYLRLLYARAGEAYSYLSGEKMVKYTEEQILELILNDYKGKRIYILAPLVRNRKGHYKELFEQIRKKGYLYVRVDGEVREALPGMKLDRYKNHDVEVVIDKLVVADKDDTRLKFLLDVGLDYLSLDRSAVSLSGGESQRIRLATQIGSQLVNVLYILDEPSIGLHQRDNLRLIHSLKELRDMGNSVIVVEHDKDMMLAADYVIDMGPKAGRLGGEVVFAGTPQQMLRTHTLTSRYLNGECAIEVPAERRKGNGHSLWLRGARGNNLKNVDVEFPLGKLICVTGVSGSGKSTLINETLQPILSQKFYRSLQDPLEYGSIEGLEYIDKVVNVDQSPLGRTPRSNPATYTGVFSDIRNLFVGLPEAKIRGYKAGRFSFNVSGGRCEACQGNGYKTIEMNFLPDVYVPCEVCHGKRYNRETLEVRFKGKSIADVLDMTINRAVEFFENVPQILNKIKVIQEVGLGYIKLGQSSTTLSGGESQRVKLATELSKRDTGKTLYILDEPTTGLHFEDIRVLMNVLNKLVDKGNTVIVIEHNLDVIKMADYIIDMGPEGGKGGGELLSCGTPEEVAMSTKGYTPKFLKEELHL